MDEQVDQEPQEIKLIVSEEMRSYIYDTTKWARFLSIVGFVISAFLIISSLGIGAAISSNPTMLAKLGPLSSIGAIGVTVLYLLLALMYFYPSLLLFRFSNKARLGILYGDQKSLNDSMFSMKSLFKFWGILTIVIIISYFVLIIVVSASIAKI